MPAPIRATFIPMEHRVVTSAREIDRLFQEGGPLAFELQRFRRDADPFERVFAIIQISDWAEKQAAAASPATVADLRWAARHLEWRRYENTWIRRLLARLQLRPLAAEPQPPESREAETDSGTITAWSPFSVQRLTAS